MEEWCCNCVWDMHPQTEMRGDHVVGGCYGLTTEGFPKRVKSMVPRGWGLFQMEEAATGMSPCWHLMLDPSFPFSLLHAHHEVINSLQQAATATMFCPSL